MGPRSHSHESANGVYATHVGDVGAGICMSEEGALVVRRASVWALGQGRTPLLFGIEGG